MKTGHVIQKCAHGTVAMQCRCIGEHKPVVVVPCPPSCPTPEQTPQSLDRAVFASFMSPGKAEVH